MNSQSFGRITTDIEHSQKDCITEKKCTCARRGAKGEIKEVR